MAFNIERALWWGGMLERLILSTKCCLKNVVGKAKLDCDELLTMYRSDRGGDDYQFPSTLLRYPR